MCEALLPRGGEALELLHKQLAESVRKLGVRLNYRFAATPQVRFRVRVS